MQAMIADAREWASKDEELMLVIVAEDRRIVLFKGDIESRTDEELAALIGNQQT